MSNKERIKLKKEIDRSTRARKVASMINSVNQQNLKMKKVKSKVYLTNDSI
jgi:hypothetical protein